MPPFSNHHPRRVLDSGSGPQGTQIPPADAVLAGSRAPSILPRPGVELASHHTQEMSSIPLNFDLFPPSLVSQEMESSTRPLLEAP